MSQGWACPKGGPVPRVAVTRPARPEAVNCGTEPFNLRNLADAEWYEKTLWQLLEDLWEHFTDLAPDALMQSLLISGWQQSK